MKYVRQLRIPSNLSHKDILNIKKDKFHCSRIEIQCKNMNCATCMIDDLNKVYFDHWFKNQYKGDRTNKKNIGLRK